eukprot:jgi/Mesvir1/21582/Mv04021-RA.1
MSLSLASAPGVYSPVFSISPCEGGHFTRRCRFISPSRSLKATSREVYGAGECSRSPAVPKPLSASRRPLEPAFLGIKAHIRQMPAVKCSGQGESPSHAVASQTNEPSVATVYSVKQLLDKYKVWILDQFGVLHDGKTAYPGALQAVAYLHAQGAKLLLLSNSSRRADYTLQRLAPLGYDPAMFAGAVTSGEITHTMLARRSDPWFAALGRKCVHFTWADRGTVSLDGLGLTLVESVEEADFLLAHGTQAIATATAPSSPAKHGSSSPPPSPKPLARPASIDEMMTLFPRAVERGLPLIVANPDVVTVSGADLVPMPGTLARRYKELGGEVRIMGKPAEIAFQACIQMADADKATMVMIGDSIEHDIQGANAAGIDSVLIASGIHWKDFGLPPPNTAKGAGDGSSKHVDGPVHYSDVPVDTSGLQKLVESHKACPSYVMHSFQI